MRQSKHIIFVNGTPERGKSIFATLLTVSIDLAARATQVVPVVHDCLHKFHQRLHGAVMAVQITIRGVPEAVRDKLSA